LSTAQYDTPSINEYNPLMPQYSKQQQQTYIPPPASPLTFAPNTANPYSSQQPPPPSYPSVFAPITQANPYGAIPTPSSLSPSTDADLGTGSVPKTEEEILAMAKEAGLDGEAMLAAARKAAAEAAPS
jgi:hypothetical protein